MRHRKSAGTRVGFRQTIMRGLALLLCTTLCGCTDQTQTRSSTLSGAGILSALSGSARDTGVSLSVFAMRDTFSSVDSVRLGYVVRNHGAAALLRLDPRFFEVHMYDDTGKPVPVRTVEWHGSTGTSSDVLLPAGGFLGQVFDLRCGHIGVEPLQSCDRQFAIARPGRYSVLMMYSSPQPPDGSRARFPTLSSDTVRFVIAPNK